MVPIHHINSKQQKAHQRKKSCQQICQKKAKKDNAHFNHPFSHEMKGCTFSRMAFKANERKTLKAL